MPLKLIIGPTATPVSVAEVMDSFRGDDASAFTAQATMIIKALTRQAEARTGRALITQTFELIEDAFPCAGIDLCMPDVQSVVTLKYLDTNGAQQTLSSGLYWLDSDSTPCTVYPVATTPWPNTYAQINAVRVRFTVGFGDTADKVPDDIRCWIIAHAIQILENPSGTIDQSFKPLPFVDALLDPYRVYRAF